MITKSLWNNFDTLKHYTIKPSIFIESLTPSELAVVFILYIIVTPFCILLDLIFLPIEAIHYIIKKHYEKMIEIERNKKQ
jgi:hypothetical protein